MTAETSSDYATAAVTPAEGDDPDTEGVEVALVEGQNVITVTVTAEDGTTGTYTVTVTPPGFLNDRTYREPEQAHGGRKPHLTIR